MEENHEDMSPRDNAENDTEFNGMAYQKSDAVVIFRDDEMQYLIDRYLFMHLLAYT